jgi:hypothetical protein
MSGVNNIEQLQALQPLPPSPPHRAWFVLAAVVLWGCGGGHTLDTLSLPGAAVSVYTATDDATDVAPAGGGDVWVATGGGLLLHDADGSEQRKISRRHGLPHCVRELLVDRQGDLWAATTRGLARLDSGGVRVFTTADGLNDDHVLALAEDRSGRLFVGTRRGVSLRRGERFEPLDDTHEFGRRATYDIHAGDDGRVLFAKENALTELDETGGWRVFQRDPSVTGVRAELPRNSLLQVAVDPAGRPWVGSTEGLGFLGTEGWTTIPHRAGPFRDGGLADNHAAALSIGSRGDLWVAHGDARHFDGGRGVSRLMDGDWTHWSVADGLPSNRIHRVRADDAGGVWLAGAGGAAHLTDDHVAGFASVGELPDNNVRRIVVLPGDEVAVLTASGLRLFRSGAAVATPQPPELPETICRRQGDLLARSGSRWFALTRGDWSELANETATCGTAAGDLRVDRLRPPGHPRFRARVAVTDDRGRTWVGSRAAGLLVKEAQQWSVVRLEGTSLPAEITALAFENDRTLWVGSAAEGALRLRLDVTVPPS